MKNITTRMIAHPCQRYQWYVSHIGFDAFTQIRQWKYTINQQIEHRGVEYFRIFGWEIGDIPECSLENIKVSRGSSIFTSPENLNVDTLEPNVKYQLLVRAMGGSAYKRVENVKIHKVNVNITLQALLDYHILATNDYYLTPAVMLIGRDGLEIHIDSLFKHLSKYSDMAKEYFNDTIIAIKSDKNEFDLPKNNFHCANCIFKKSCQGDLNP